MAAVTRLALPLTILTFGLGSLLLNAGTVALAFYAVDGRTPAVRAEHGIAFVLAVVARCSRAAARRRRGRRHLRVVRRRVRRARAAAIQTEVPGVIMFEIDGLGEGVMREAVRDGHVPTIARWLAEGSHRLHGLGVRPLLADRGEPGRAAAGKQLGHARLSLV